MINIVKNNWKNIWGNKSIVSEQNDNIGEFQRFCELKKANGFDVAVDNKDAYYRAFYDEWIEFYDTIMKLTDGELKSVYEIGCGSGVNLYMFENRISCTVGGADYSEVMIESVKRAVRGKDFKCCDASEVSITPKYDLVMSESVFQYFESVEYAEKVLRLMLNKSNKIVYIGEVHDKEYESELIEYRRNTIQDYDIKYDGLKKMFYSRDWIEQIAKEYGKNVQFTQYNNPEYINSKYVFGCYLY